MEPQSMESQRELRLTVTVSTFNSCDSSLSTEIGKRAGNCMNQGVVRRVYLRLPQPLRRSIRCVRQSRLRRTAKARVRRALRRGDEIRLVLGCSYPTIRGWINTDHPWMDITDGRCWNWLLDTARADRLLAEHVFEHLTLQQATQALQLARANLSERGTLRIAVPDGNHPVHEYIEQVRPGGLGPGADDHKVLYTAETLVSLVQEAGLRADLRRWCDAEGTAHVTPLASEFGPIRRSGEAPTAPGEGPEWSLVIDCHRDVHND